MNFNFSRDKVIIGVAIIALAGFDYYRSNSDSLNSNQIRSIVDAKQADNIDNQSEVENKENEDDSSKVCRVDGCVNKPGVYSFKRDDRIKDIIGLAGGFTKDADTKGVNLTMKLKDEMKIFIPSEDETSKQQDHGTENSQIATLKDNNSTSFVSISTADSSKLQTLLGIGPSKAKKVIEFREKNRFRKIEELKNIDGISERTLESLKSPITID